MNSPAKTPQKGAEKLPPQMEAALAEMAHRLEQGFQKKLNQMAAMLEKDTGHKLEGAVQRLERTVKGGEAVPLAEDHVQESAVMNDQGVQLFYRGELEQASQFLENATRINPKSVAAWCNLGAAYTALKQTEKAIQALRVAVELDPNRADLLNSKGVMALMDNKPEDALSFLEEANRAEPNHVSILLNLAQAHKALGQHGRAVQAWKLAVSIDPAQEEALHNLRQYYQ